MGVTGSYTTCTGEQCLSNAGLGTPTLAYGTATGVGPFVCESSTAGITCTGDGKGFRISRSGITPACKAGLCWLRESGGEVSPCPAASAGHKMC